jgi:hypothetical protein
MFIARQRLGKQVPAATNKQATTDVFLSYNDGNGFSFGSAPRLYNEDFRPAESEIKESLEMAIKDD